MNVTTSSGNRMILNPTIDVFYGQLQFALSSSTVTKEFIKKVWQNYFTAFLANCIFVPSTPPSGLILPYIGILKVYIVTPFSGDIEILSDESKISMFSSLLKAWIISNQTLETWSRMGLDGIVLAPPVNFPLKVLA